MLMNLPDLEGTVEGVEVGLGPEGAEEVDAVGTLRVVEGGATAKTIFETAI